MNKSVVWFAVALLCAGLSIACGQQFSVYADAAYQSALDEILPAFADHTGFQAQLTIDSSSNLAERIRSGESADLFFSAEEEAMRRAMEMGLVDVTLKRNVLALPPGPPAEDGTPAEPQYASAAVLANAAQRLQAMALLEFLTSDAARLVFERKGFALP